MKKITFTILTAIVLIAAMFALSSCDIPAMLGLDNPAITEDEKPTTVEEPEKDPGYYLESGNPGEYSLDGAYELVATSDTLTAKDNEGNTIITLELDNGTFTIGRRTVISVSIKEEESITLTQEDTEPLIYQYED